MEIVPFKLERFFEKHEFTAPYLLCASDCETLSTRELLALAGDAALAGYLDLRLGYTETRGHPDLRAAIAQLYERVTSNDLLVLAGAEEGIFIFANVLLSARDHAVVLFPAYQSAYSVAEALGCAVSRWRLVDDGTEWTLDLNALEDLIQPNTKAIIVNFPHNPTGYLPPREVYQQIIEIARAHDLYLFSDEVYRGLEYNPADRLPGGADEYERAVSLGVMSKTYGLAGLRLGWIATRDRALLNKIAAFKDYTTICTSAPSEYLATVALRHRAQIVARNLEIVQANLAALDAFFARHANVVTWHRPKAGSIAFPRFVGEVDAEEKCAEIIAETGVLLAPGVNFDCPGAHFRVGFGRNPARFAEGLERLDNYLS